MKIKSCPFCEGDGALVPADYYGVVKQVICLDPRCVARGPRRDIKEEAIKMWNRRINEDTKEVQTSRSYNKCKNC